MNDSSRQPGDWRWFIRVCTDLIIFGVLLGLLYYAILRGLLRLITFGLL